MNQFSHLHDFIRGRKHLFFVFFICLLTGTCSGFKYYNESQTGDAGYYYRSALLIEEQFSNLFHSPKIGVVESLNAVFQGMVFTLPGNDFLNVYALQIFIFSLTGVFVFKLAREFIGSTGAAITILFYIINHHHWAHIYNFKPGVWVNLFIILLFYYIYHVFKNFLTLKHYILTGVSSAFLLLTDLRYLPHLMLVYFMFFFVSIPTGQKLKNISISVLVALILITPWVVRQSMVFDRFVFISDLNTMTIHRALGTRFYESLAKYRDDLIDVDENEYNERFWELSESLGLSPGQLVYAWGDIQKSMANSSDIPIKEKYQDLIQRNIFSEEEIASIIEHKENQPWLMKRFNRAYYLWAPFNFLYRYDPLHGNKIFIPPASKFNNINRIVTVGIMLPFMLVGLFLLTKRKNLFGIALFGFFLSHTVVHALTYVQWRYLLPILPFVTMIAYYGASELWMHFRHYTKKWQQNHV